MTVFNTSYSTIDEAWGDPYSCPPLQQQEQQIKKKKKRTVINTSQQTKDPICELYAMGDTHYNDADIVSYANQFYQKQDNKFKQQRSKMPPSRESMRHVDIRENQLEDDHAYAEQHPSKYDDDYSEHERDQIDAREMDPNNDIDTLETYIPRSHTVEKYYDASINNAHPCNGKRRLYESHDYVVSADDPDARDASFQWMDIILYVFSGLILIFMMEQFVKIGLLMQ